MQSVLADSRRRDEEATSHTASEGDANRKRACGQIRVSVMIMVEKGEWGWGTGGPHSQMGEDRWWVSSPVGRGGWGGLSWRQGLPDSCAWTLKSLRVR